MLAVDDAIAAIARHQLGHVTRLQLRDVGVNPAAERRRVRGGTLVPVGARTYRVASAPGDLAGEVLAACLDRDGVASHRTGAWFHSLMPPPGLIEVTVAKGRSTTVPRAGGRSLRVHATTNLPADDIVTVGPLPVTSVARTLFGLASLVPEEISHAELLDVVSVAIEEGKASVAWLSWLLEERRCRGRNGVVAFERVLAERAQVGPTESWLERELVRLLDRAGLPRPTPQRVIRRSGRFAARVDFAYDTRPIIIEALGYAFHRTSEQVEADTMRANDLQLLGYQVLQFTSRQMARRPESVVLTVAKALDLPVPSR